MAKSLREVEEQMSSVGIDVPPGVDLVVNGSNWKRFKPANSHFKRGKEAYYGIWEKSLGSGRNYYFGVFGIGSQSYKITHTRSGWTQEEWREIKSRTETDQKIVDEALQERRRSAGQKAVKMLQAASSSVSMSHPYVAKKQILPYGAYQLRNQILLPMWKDGRVVGLQTIFPAETQDGSTEIQKRFLSGSDLKGSCLKLGEPAQPPEADYFDGRMGNGLQHHAGIRRTDGRCGLLCRKSSSGRRTPQGRIPEHQNRHCCR